MSTLEQDLARYANEVYTDHDIKAGWKLISELMGLVTLGGIAVTALTVWLPGIGLPISGGVAVQILRQLTQTYANLDEEERKQVRAVVNLINKMFGL